MLKTFLTTFLTTLILISCVVSPTGRKQFMFMPEEQMDQMGAQAFANVKQQTPVETDDGLNQYVRCVTTAIVQISNSATKQWEVAVFRDDSANAFALPGGKVGVHTGMFNVASTQDQLATVIGHEIAHVLSKHGNERVSQEYALEQGLALIQALANPQSQTGLTLMGLLGVGVEYGILLPYGRVQESEADLLGLNLMARAGFKPTESVALWQNMSRQATGEEPPEFMSTHPSHTTRINDLNNAMNSAMPLYQQARTSGRSPRCNL